jgi:TetR/AcrR family transcriptional repressor of mexJK operon
MTSRRDLETDTGTAAEASAGAAEEGRSARKRQAILQAATTIFLGQGYLGTSMDEIAAHAGVSKQTVYKHFIDKEALFREVVTDVVRARDGGITPDILLTGERSMEEQLRPFARNFLRGVMQPEVLMLRRLVIGEVGRFPELGQAFYDLGPKRATTQLAVALKDLATRIGIAMQDPILAAEHMLWLILSIPLNQAMLLGDAASFSESDLDTYADQGVSAFLRAYGFSTG